MIFQQSKETYFAPKAELLVIQPVPIICESWGNGSISDDENNHLGEF